MITKNIEYIKPSSVEEAYNVFKEIMDEGLTPIYYSGGTEVSTFMRKDKVDADAIIDIKSIPLLGSISKNDEEYFLGSAVSLNKIIDLNIYPIISSVLKTIADRTTRNHITLGGNICGRLAFREAILPFMLIPNSSVKIYSEGVIKTIPLNDIFISRLKLGKGDLFLGITFPDLPLVDSYVNIRRTKSGEIDYPLLHLVVKKSSENKISIACSGFHAFPYLYEQIEHKGANLEELSNNILDSMTQKIKSDTLGSADYRLDMMKIALYDSLEKLEVII